MTQPAPSTRRRADARRNVEKIVRAAIECLGRNRDATLAEIASAAGVGRVTLYGHFPSREALLEAAIGRALADGNEVLGSLDLSGPPRDALRTLIEASWHLTAQASAVLEAAQLVLPPGRIHDLHAEPERRVMELIRRGQAEGEFRGDLPAGWLASTLHYVMNGAATDVAAGRLERDDAGQLIAEVIAAAYSPPPS